MSPREERLESDLAALRIHLQYLWGEAIASPEYKAWRTEHTSWWQRKGGDYHKMQDLYKTYEASPFKASYNQTLTEYFEIEGRAKRRNMWV